MSILISLYVYRRRILINTDILGIVIHLPYTYTSNPNLGVYGNQIRLSETPLYATDAYTPGRIVKVGSIPLNSDFSTGGNVKQATSVDITILNTGGYYQRILELGINLTGLMVQVREFIGEPINSDSVSSDYIFTGYITDLQIDSTTIQITVRSNMSEARRANIGQLIALDTFPNAPESNVDRIVPVMFGNSDPVNGRYFKILQTAAKNDTLHVMDTIFYDEDDTLNPKTYQFPVEFPFNLREFRVFWGYDNDASDLGISVMNEYPDWFKGLYLFCTEGPAGIIGTMRKISDFFATGGVYPDTEMFIELTIADYLPELTAGNHDMDAEDQTYFELHDIDVRYLVSANEVIGICDSVTGIKQLNNFDLFVKDDTISKLMSADIIYSTLTKELIIDPRIYSNTDLSKTIAYDCYPAKLIDRMMRADFNEIGRTGYNVLLPGAVPAPGLNSPSVSGITVNEVNTIGSPFDALDRQSGTDHQWITEYKGLSGAANTVEIGFKVTPPTLVPGYKFTNCYLGINMTVGVTKDVRFTALVDYAVFLRKPFKTGEHLSDGNKYYYLNVNNIPDFYYITNPETGNYNFFVTTPNTGNGAYNVRGYKNFKLDIKSQDDLENIKYISIITRLDPDYINYNAEVTIEDVCFIFEREQALGSEIFA